MKYILLFSLLSCTLAGLAHRVGDPIYYNVKDYGARGDERSLEGGFINKAIAAAAAKGGGTVYFPAGKYLTGSIRLQSNITLLVDQGAELVAAPVSAENGYDEEETGSTNGFQDRGHSHWHNSLIWGERLHDVSVIGSGLINGTNLYKGSPKDKDTRQSANKAIALLLCRNVLIRDVSILNGGWFAILATGVDNLTLDNVKMDTNRDGVDVDGCKNVRISNCFVNSPYDDGICLKSSFALGYARPTENVTITNCQVSGYDVGTLLDGTYKRTYNTKYHYAPTGRIKFGKESNGGFRNIAISNCIFEYCGGLAIESVDGAVIEDVTVSNITMRDVVNDPIFLRLGARMRGPAGTPIGQLRRIAISNIIAYNVDPEGACTISGLPGHTIEDVSLSNIHLYFRGGGSADSSNNDIPEREAKYPEPGMFDCSPAYGAFIRHARNISLTDVKFGTMQPDRRPAVRMDDVQGVFFHHVVCATTDGSPAIILKNVSGMIYSKSPDLENR